MSCTCDRSSCPMTRAQAKLDHTQKIRETNNPCDHRHTTQCRTSYRLEGGETICPPPPIAVRLAADLRPSADGSAGHTWLSCRQPACLQPNAAARLVQLRHGTERQTYGRIAVSLNSPSYGGDIISRGYIACVKNEFDSLGCFDIEYRHFSTLCAIEIK